MSAFALRLDPAPATSTWRATSNCSRPKGTTHTGTPAASAFWVMPMPPWHTTQSARSRIGPGPRYTVVVSTRDPPVLYRRSGVVATRLDLPSRTLAGVPSGAEIVWRVEGIVPGGSRISSETFVSRVQ